MLFPFPKFWRAVSVLLFLTALLGLLKLASTDATRGLRFDAEHIRLDAPPILFVGLAYIAFQFSQNTPWRTRGRGILLGLAFAIWGGEAYLPANAATTVLDDLAMSIFVIDLGLTILGKMKLPQTTPKPGSSSQEKTQQAFGQAD